jgi:hypothetical protein
LRLNGCNHPTSPDSRSLRENLERLGNRLSLHRLGSYCRRIQVGKSSPDDHQTMKQAAHRDLTEVGAVGPVEHDCAQLRRPTRAERNAVRNRQTPDRQTVESVHNSLAKDARFPSALRLEVWKAVTQN